MRKIINLAIGILMVGMAGIATAAPIQWLTQNGGNNHWYDIVVTDADDYYSGLSTGINFEDARDAAEAMGGHLATPSLVGETAFIYSNLVAPTSEAKRQAFWLGAYTIGDGYTWVTGEAVTSWSSYAYIDWAYGYPQALVIFPNNWWTASDALQDAPQSFPANGFLVEYETLPPAAPVPEPSTLLLLAFGITSLAFTKRLTRK